MCGQPSDKELGQGVRLLRLINGVREKHHVEPLTQLETLDNAAWQMVMDMLKFNHRKGHQDTRHSWPNDRAKKVGYRWIPVAENLAYNVRSAQAAVDAWMANPEYRENILSRNFAATGVASRRNHYVQVFGPKRS